MPGRILTPDDSRSERFKTSERDANVLDQYSQCPCGSGKKFKWCCLPIHVEISKAFQQDQEGQHESALRIMDQVVAQHADNPEAWGKKALLLWQNEKPEEAEAALSKAFEVMPEYPFGHFLRGRFRMFEGEIAGALLLFRKAAELYDPTANQLLIEIFLNIFECEMKLNRPIAARAAAMLALKCDPNNVQLRQGVDEVFGEKNPNMPAAALKSYVYIPTKKIGRAAWDKAMARINTSRLTDVLRAFEELAKADPDDPNVWFNLGLTQAWLGNNAAAIESFDKYLAQETDETLAAEATTLVEVLRVGQGMEDFADYVEHATTVPLRDPQAFVNGLVQLEKEGKIAGLRMDQEQGILAGFVLEDAPVSLVPADAPPQKLGAFFMLMGSILRVWNVDQNKVEVAFKMFREKIGQGMGEPFQSRGPAKFQDVIAPALVVPLKAGSQEDHDRIVRDHIGRYFEETWIHRPLKSLGNVPAIDAAGNSTLRRKLIGVVNFLEQVSGMGQKEPAYDFNRLRRKLNLIAGGDAPAAKAAAGEIGAMNVPELIELAVESLDAGQLETAFQTALGLDAKHVAGKFAAALVSAPPRADRADRYPWHNHLVNLALAEDDFQGAIDRLNDGEKDDCENNEGRRRNDFELRRAQILVKKGDHQEAEDTFTRLIGRVPNEWKYRGAATEAFLSARQGSRAVKFAESALADAKTQNNRDQEGYFGELLEAAKRQG